MRDRIASGHTAQRHLAAGIDALADVLAVTLGPLGRSVVIENELTHKPDILDSAAEIAQRLTSLSTPHQNTGAMLLRHVVWRVVSQTGDGGATTAVFVRALYREALRLATAGIDPQSLCAGIEAASAVVLQALRQQTRPVETEDDLARLAFSLVDEKPLATILGEMSYLLGQDAVVAIERYAAPTIDRGYVSGSAYPAQIASPMFYTHAAKKQAAASDVLVALLDDALQTGEEAATLLQAALQAGRKQLAILTSKSISEKALAVLGATHRNTAVPLSIIPVRLTEADQARRYPLSDLALLTGATIVSAAAGQPVTSLYPGQFGSARRVEVTDARVILETSERAAVQHAIEDLRLRLDAESDAAASAQLRQRLAALTGGLGYLRIGAYGDQQRAVRSKSAERALKVLSAAQRSGVVAGGGAALVHAAAALQALEVPGDPDRHGVKLFAHALSTPMLQIVQNAGVDAPGAWVHRTGEARAPMTFDVARQQLVNAHASGIVTPTSVLEAVVRHATSAVIMALSTETILYHRADASIESVNP